MLASFSLGTVERALNQYLALDPETKKRLNNLEGKTITMILKPFGLSFQVHIEGGSLQLLSGEPHPAEIKITGTPLSLLGIALNPNNKRQFFSDDMVIEGNIDQGQQLIDLFDQVDIDWEELLSKLIGDIPAYETCRFIKSIKSWSSQSIKTLLRNTDEYIHEEKTWLPPAEELNDFYNEVDELRMAVDRLEARIRNLAC